MQDPFEMKNVLTRSAASREWRNVEEKQVRDRSVTSTISGTCKGKWKERGRERAYYLTIRLQRTFILFWLRKFLYCSLLNKAIKGHSTPPFYAFTFISSSTNLRHSLRERSTSRCGSFNYHLHSSLSHLPVKCDSLLLNAEVTFGERDYLLYSFASHIIS